MAKILIVEDEPAIADTIQYALETEGFTPLTAPTGQEALEQMAAHVVDLVILDIGLPDINGFELCKRIRHHSALPIIFLTARSEEVDRVVGL
jgi:two-component system catabolic regulation response regulator CreB